MFVIALERSRLCVNYAVHVALSSKMLPLLPDPWHLLPIVATSLFVLVDQAFGLPLLEIQKTLLLWLMTRGQSVALITTAF